MTTSSPTPTPTLTSYRQVHALLTLAAHRNKNQHSHARWWSALGILRRAVGRLVAEMEMLEGVVLDGKGRRLKGKEKREMVERVEARKAWMRGFVVGRCWIAFSAVVADNQYSALGLMLLGTLARVNRLLGPAPDDDSKHEPEAETKAKNEPNENAIGQGEHAAMMQISEMEFPDQNVDLGEKIEREKEFDTEVEMEMDRTEKLTLETEIDFGNVEDKGEKRAAETEKGEITSEPPKKKKKKRKRDAIDDLFAGLI